LSTSSARLSTNPARLSSLSTLFALPVVAAELQLASHDPGSDEESGSAPLSIEARARSLLTPREYDSIRHCAERRMWDFCAGRLCAHRALAEFGWVEFDLLAGQDRQPLWPPGLTGSITHTEGFSAAVVAERGSVAALGIDAERISAVHSELWSAICSPSELARLRALAGDSQALAAALTFAAKEAFYKCQYPLAAERFEFGEVHLEETDWEAAAGSFWVTVQRASRLDHFLPSGAHRRLEGRFCRREPYLVTGLALPAI
jgi:4'-phosphopantetheinyl transferase EntD